jgi:5-methylthioribose kinase
LAKGNIYPKVSSQMSDYFSNILFKTSGLYLTQTEMMKRIGYFSDNQDLCHLTQQVIFQQPYYKNDNNKWTKGLDQLVQEVYDDKRLKIASLKLLNKFRSNTQCLIHGDLHTGSVMVNSERTSVIDGEV